MLGRYRECLRPAATPRRPYQQYHTIVPITGHSEILCVKGLRRMPFVPPADEVFDADCIAHASSAADAVATKALKTIARPRRRI